MFILRIDVDGFFVCDGVGFDDGVFVDYGFVVDDVVF